ncbi:MAG: alpha/beta hydrolase family protein, partial [Candidatus Binatia bacterium]
DYLEHDLDNYFRARGRTIGEATSPDYHVDFTTACLDTSTRAVAKQGNDLRFGRIYGGVGQATCWWSTGHAPDYFDVSQHRVYWLSRNGSKIQGHVWAPQGAAPGPRPAVVVTTGSINASDQMYWWANRALAMAGYIVLSWDVQGQGQSETFGHEPGSPAPTADGVPFQQAPNFDQGTIDALRFLFSTPAEPYSPTGWSAEDVAAARAAAGGEQLDWFNPQWASLDRDNVGIAGHSLGAGSVSRVQQCSRYDSPFGDQDLPSVCDGQKFPIRAVVAWDALSANVTPVVPAMDQKADGYFLFPTLTPSAPDPNESLNAYSLWKGAGLDVFMYVVRAGTHIDWSQVPYTASTTYGWFANAYYTVAWMDRWVNPDPAVQADALERLLTGPFGGPDGDPSLPWSANHFSARRYSALSMRDAGDDLVEAVDLRAWTGRSPVGDWAGANADTEGRVLP